MLRTVPGLQCETLLTSHAAGLFDNFKIESKAETMAIQKADGTIIMKVWKSLMVGNNYQMKKTFSIRWWSGLTKQLVYHKLNWNWTGDI